MAITVTISEIPEPPSRTDPANFDVRADAFLSALDGLETELNSWAGEANTLASTVNTDANAASTSESNASTHASNASTSASNANTAKLAAEAAAAAAQSAAGLPALTGKAGKPLIVNATEDGVLFDFAYPDMTGNSKKIVRVNTGETDIEYVDQYPAMASKKGYALVVNAGETDMELGIPGAMVEIITDTVSSQATVELTLSGFNEFWLHLRGWRPVTSNRNLCFRSSSDGGTTFDSGASDYLKSGASSSTFQIAGNVGNLTGQPGADCWIRICNVNESRKTQFHVDGVYQQDGGTQQNIATGALRDASAIVDAIQLYFQSSNIQTGAYTLYGVKN